MGAIALNAVDSFFNFSARRTKTEIYIPISTLLSVYEM